MTDNKTLQLALLISILAHAVFFLGIPNMPFLPSKRSLETLKITYYKIKEMPEKKVAARKRAEPIARKLPEIKKEDMLKPVKPAGRKRSNARTEARRIVPGKKAEEKKFETVIKEEADEAKRATYISYYRAVRERIRQQADRNYPRRRGLGQGEVFLSFVVASSGELLQVGVVNERSTSTTVLRKIAIDSIRDSSPFPPFPKGMSQYQITFNVIIAFELNR